jgi:hypothetical protein
MAMPPVFEVRAELANVSASVEGRMCRRVTCERCDKPTFAGCGMHVDQVLRDVPPESRCRCHERRPSEPRVAPPPRK